MTDLTGFWCALWFCLVFGFAMVDTLLTDFFVVLLVWGPVGWAIWAKY